MHSLSIPGWQGERGTACPLSWLGVPPVLVPPPPGQELEEDFGQIGDKTEEYQPPSPNAGLRTDPVTGLGGTPPPLPRQAGLWTGPVTRLRGSEKLQIHVPVHTELVVSSRLCYLQLIGL